MDDKFIDEVIAKAKAEGKVVTREQVIEASKSLSDEDLAKVTGGYFGIDDLIDWFAKLVGKAVKG